MPAAARATYRDIADHFRKEIITGVYPAGTYLPNADTLMARHGISTNTLSRAYKILLAEGLIYRVPRYGMLVQDPHPQVVDLILHNPHGHGPLPWSECCTLAGVEGHMVTNGITSKGAGPEVAALLGRPDHTAIVVRSRTAFIGDAPVRLDEAIYPRDLVEGTPIATEHLVPGGIYSTLAQAGHAPAAIARRTAGARLATGDEAKKLKLASGSWVLAADQVIADPHGRAVELLRIVANPNRVRFTEEHVPLAGGMIRNERSR
ncbi:GntR family transcriptional regulator [Nonomuraea sp. NPDC049141]|uniref:GntR family transcriptional regulator n=1 Tax=Nonomuraea sp. NPDC049141 TaxID=3155500 RepID=UPI0033CE3176